MVALKLAFVTLSRKNVSVVSVGVSVGMQNANGPMSRVGGMLAAMDVMKNAVGTLPLRNRTGGVVPLSGAFAAATD